MPLIFISGEPIVFHSLTPPMILYFNPSKGPYWIISLAHSDTPIRIYSSLPKFPSSAHSDLPSQIYLSFPKNYLSMQVKSPTWFLQKIIQIYQVRFIHHCLNLLQNLIQICQVIPMILSFNTNKSPILDSFSRSLRYSQSALFIIHIIS